MNVASKTFCQELYEVSGWEDTAYIYSRHHPSEAIPNREPFTNSGTPAYDLGYLLRKLPDYYAGCFLHLDKETFGWSCYLSSQEKQTADTPEDAACKLILELFKQKILV